MTFPTPDTGWAAGALNYIRTIDGGHTWTTMPTPTGAQTILFITSKLGYVTSNGTIYRTVDGGGSWTPSVTGGADLEGIAFVNPDTGFAVGLSYAVRTNDSGKTWTSQQLTAVHLRAVSFSSPSVGYAVGDRQKFDPDKEQSGACYITTNGGDTWTQVYTGMTEVDLYGVAAIDDTTLVVVGGGGFKDTQGFLGRIARTTNAGNSWTYDSTFSAGGLWSVSFSDRRNGVAVGDPGLILRTTDGGIHWSQQISPTQATLTAIKMLNDSVGVIVGDSGYVLRTSNGGAGVSSPFIDSLQVLVYPNPGQQDVQFQYALPTASHVSFAVYSSDGSLAGTLLSNALQPPGINLVTFSTSAFASGSYFYQIQTGSGSQSGTFTIIK